MERVIGVSSGQTAGKQSYAARGEKGKFIVSTFDPSMHTSALSLFHTADRKHNVRPNLARNPLTQTTAMTQSHSVNCNQSSDSISFATPAKTQAYPSVGTVVATKALAVDSMAAPRFRTDDTRNGKRAGNLRRPGASALALLRSLFRIGLFKLQNRLGHPRVGPLLLTQAWHETLLRYRHASCTTPAKPG